MGLPLFAFRPMRPPRRPNRPAHPLAMKRDKMRQNEIEIPAPLTQNQLAAIPFLASSPTVSEAAKRIDITRATIYRWMEDDEFRAELQHQRNEAAHLARAELKGLMLKSICVFADAMEDPNPQIRLKAARDSAYIAIKIDENETLRNRIDRLDDAIHLWKEKDFD